MFESSVISYGCQTFAFVIMLPNVFESSVISYGCQTMRRNRKERLGFESSVISYGCQTGAYRFSYLGTFESSVISYINDLVQQSTGKNRRVLYEKNDSLRIDAVRKK